MASAPEIEPYSEMVTLGNFDRPTHCVVVSDEVGSSVSASSEGRCSALMLISEEEEYAREGKNDRDMRLMHISTHKS